jgi:carbamoyltransferase
MLVLGINGGDKREDEHDFRGGYYHDAAAVLLRDGKLVAAIEEERLNRIKHSNCFPAHAIRFCLDRAGVTIADIDRIAISTALWNVMRREMELCLADLTRALPDKSSGNMAKLFHQHFGVDVLQKLRFVDHHHAHAWSAYALSGFTKALVLSIDAVGDGCSGKVFHACDKRLETLHTYPLDRSLGALYYNMISFLGFGDFEEYKAMGLAPYGDPQVYGSLFRENYRLLPKGDYEIKGFDAWFACFDSVGLLAHIRRRGESFTQVHMDFAAALQNTLEDIVFHVLRYYRAERELKQLCLAGGVAHNCTLNGKILNAGLFERVFVQPAAHDAGTSLGAALMIAFQEESDAQIIEIPHVFLGTHIGSNEEIAQTLDCWKEFIVFEQVPDIVVTSAQLLADGAVIGWVQGRSEFGPRALGNRSIVADPRPPDNKDRINAMIKKREGFRPFAPSVVEERMGEYFVSPLASAQLSFMTYVISVKEQSRHLLGAITHVDGTARVQTVSQSSNHKFWRLLNAFGEITGTPILLNTSFNNNVEPIVESVEDALACFLTTELDYLVVGDYLIHRPAPLKLQSAIEWSVPSLPPYCRLEITTKRDSETGLMRKISVIAHVKDGRFHRTTEISPAMSSLLVMADGSHSIGELRNTVVRDDCALDAELTAEALRLWGMRMLSLHPRLGGGS